jgi:tRNA pseudouridine38-40 synthase
MYIAKWEQNGAELKFTVSANRFLRNMVRAIVGTMVEIEQENLSLKIYKVIEDKNRNAAGTSAPAHGLYLVDVGYEF